tara:strand:+ start:1016 stop:2122 length:1107 start_codon:yes stop_codon:yes gene_type:complete
MSNKTNKINSLNKLFLILILLSSFFAGYLNTSMPVFFFALIIICIYFFQIKFTIGQILIINVFVIYLIILLINSTSITSTLSNLKWFYGILPFLIIFKIKDVKLYLFYCLSSHKLFLSFLLIITFETILVNLFLTPELVYGLVYKSSTIEIGPFDYNRPLGGGGNSSVTSAIIVAWYYGFQKENIKYKASIFLFYSTSIILCMSGTGFILYFVGLILNNLDKLRKNFRFNFLTLVSALLIFLLFFYLFSNQLNQKLSIDYYKIVLKDKLSLMNNDGTSNETNLMNYNFGHTVSSDVPLNGDDFGWLNLFYAQGILGFIIFFLIIFVFSNGSTKNYLSAMILLLGAFHYAAIFVAAGQILLSKFIMNDK